MKKTVIFVVLFVLSFNLEARIIPVQRRIQGTKNTKQYLTDYGIVKRLHRESREEKNPKRRAILNGLVWTIQYLKNDKHFKFVFTDYVAMLYELIQHKSDEEISTIASYLLRNSYERSKKFLANIFDQDSAEDKWEFISVLPVFYTQGYDLTRFISFYKGFTKKNNYHDMSFRRAIKKKNYDALTDYVVDYAFLNFAHEVLPRKFIKLPKNRFKKVITKSSKIKFVHTIKDEDGYHDQNYFATHVLLAKTCYGRRPLNHARVPKSLRQYFVKNFYNVVHKVDDIDLVGEYVQSMKLLKQDKTPLFKKAVQMLIDTQNSDGSWSKIEKGDDPYDVFHPVWTSVIGLYYV